MKRLAILGASGHGKVVADIAECCGWDEITFFDDAWPSINSNGRWSVDGDSSVLAAQCDRYSGTIVAIGNNKIRAEMLNWLGGLNVTIVTLIHPEACVSRYADLGKGTVVMPGTIVNAAAKVGNGVILNSGCSVDHDCIIGNCSHISPGARLAGGVNVGMQAWIGIGASIIQSVSIGHNVIVGAGAVVVHDLPDCITAVGVPAKPL